LNIVILAEVLCNPHVLRYIKLEIMSALTIQKSNKGWIIELPEDFTEEIGVKKNSIGILQVSDGKIEVEVIPPPSTEMKNIIDRIHEKYKDAFAEMKRLGD